MRAAFDRRGRTMHELLDAIPGVTCLEPQGAFYCFPSFAGLLGRAIGGRTPHDHARAGRRGARRRPRWPSCPARRSARRATAASRSPSATTTWSRASAASPRCCLEPPDERAGRLALLAGGLVVLVLLAAARRRRAGGGSSADVERPPTRRPTGGDFTVDAYDGLGAWVDVFDYVPAYQNEGVSPPVIAEDVDTMASLGVKTLYLQAARIDDRTPNGLVAAELLVPFLERAHANGMRVVGWYYPKFADVDARPRPARCRSPRFDAGRPALRRHLRRHRGQPGREGPADRSNRLVELSKRLREAARRRQAVIGATVLPAVQTEVINPSYWPGVPVGPARSRTTTCGCRWPTGASATGLRYKSGYRYVTESVRRMRALVGDPNAQVHPSAGIADVISEAEVRDFLRALTDTDALGGSLYDYRTTSGGIWGVLRGIPGAPWPPRRARRPRCPTRRRPRTTATAAVVDRGIAHRR